MVGKIEVPKTTKTETKDKSVNPIPESLDTNDKSEKTVDLEGKNLSENTNAEADSNVKNDQVVKAKGATSLSGPKHIGSIDINKPIQSDSVSKVKSKKEEKPLVQNEQEVLRAKSETISGPKLTGQVIDLEQFKKPKKKVASSSNPSGNKDN